MADNTSIAQNKSKNVISSIRVNEIQVTKLQKTFQKPKFDVAFCLVYF